LGEASEKFIRDRSLDKFVPQAKAYLETYPDKFQIPQDVAVDVDGQRKEMDIDQLPSDGMIIDIGEKTIINYEKMIASAGTLFVNGPAGVYEKEIGSKGTQRLWRALAQAPGFTVIGGGDTVASANHFIDTDQLDFISTGGGALVRYISGVQLPLIDAMEMGAKN
jgi:phosphoglycerate kinase